MQGMIALSLFAVGLVSAAWMLRYDFSGEKTGGQTGFAVLDRGMGPYNFVARKRDGRSALSSSRPVSPFATEAGFWAARVIPGGRLLKCRSDTTGRCREARPAISCDLSLGPEHSPQPPAERRSPG